MNPPIIILTDFGTTDPFVGIMKGVISQIAPATPLIDLTHNVPPGSIQQGAVILWQSINYFPPGSIFLIVIDPGVGTSRRPIILQNGKYTFIAPDNGVLSFIYQKESQVWEISNPKYYLPDPGSTFHGRDIFAPAAAHASLGIEGSDFGNNVTDIKYLTLPILESPMPGLLRGQVLYADHFGNILTSLGKFSWSVNRHLDFQSWVGEEFTFSCHPESLQLQSQAKEPIHWVKTFAEVAQGECAVLIGSSGLLEIVANRQSASNLLNLDPDEPVTLRYEPLTLL